MNNNKKENQKEKPTNLDGNKEKKDQKKNGDKERN